MRKTVGRYYKVNSLEVKQGNKKLGNDTLIFNMGSAHNCPSKAMGLCEIPDGKCYAFCDENRYKNTLAYRMRQESYWNISTVNGILADFDELFTKYPKLKNEIKYLRFNESGDFQGQWAINRLSRIAADLKANYGIIVYGYTARKDLNFDNVNFIVKGSSHNKGNSGTVISRDKKLLKGKQYKENGTTYFLCPMDCRKCKLCKDNRRKYNVVIPLH